MSVRQPLLDGGTAPSPRPQPAPPSRLQRLTGSALPIARLTLADAVRNPALWATTGASLIFLGGAFVFGMFTFDVADRVRMLAVAGLAGATLHGLFLVCLLSAGAVRSEQEARTALTLFAHPVGRGAWLCGKALGVWLAVLASLVPIALAHAGLLALGWRTGFDLERPDLAFDAQALLPLGQLAAGYVLAIMHLAVLGAIAVVAALRLALPASLVLLAAVYLAGNALAAAGWPGLVLIPALGLYQIDDAVQGFADPIGTLYLAGAAVHTLLAWGGWLLLGLALFRDRDLP